MKKSNVTCESQEALDLLDAELTHVNIPHQTTNEGIEVVMATDWKVWLLAETISWISDEKGFKFTVTEITY